MSDIRSMYDAIRAIPSELAELSWSMGLPLRDVPEPDPTDKPVWVLAFEEWCEAEENKDAAKRYDVYLSDHAYNTGCEAQHPDMQDRYLCNIHQAELANMIASSPKVPEIFFEGQTIDTAEETIAKEAARLGIIMRPVDNMIDENDDMLEDVKEEGYHGQTPYWFPDARIISMIAFERSVHYSSPVFRAYPVIVKGELDVRVENVEDPSLAEAIKDHWITEVLMPITAEQGIELAKRRQTIIELSKALRNVRGKGIQVNDITGIPEAPQDYFWTDADPYRDNFHETDMEMHDVHVRREELSEAQEEELREMGLPPVGRWLFYSRNRDIIRAIGRTFIDKDIEILCTRCQKMNKGADVINGERFLRTNCYTCEHPLLGEDYTPPVQAKLAAISNVALHPIHIETVRNNIGSDTDIAGTEWDLGEDIITIEDLLAEQKE